MYAQVLLGIPHWPHANGHVASGGLINSILAWVSTVDESAGFVKVTLAHGRACGLLVVACSIQAVWTKFGRLGGPGSDGVS